MTVNLKATDIIALSHKAFDEDHKDFQTSQSAYKAVANTLLLHEDAREIFAQSQYPIKVAGRLEVKSSDRQIEIIFSRILFLLTYKTSFDFQELLEKRHLIESILNNLNFHARACKALDDYKDPDSINVRALSETLKLVFNLSQFYPKYRLSFQKFFDPIMTLLHEENISKDPLRPPVSFAVNALLNLCPQDVASDQSEQPGRHSFLFPDNEASVHVERLIRILDFSTKEYTDEALESKVIPLLTLIRHVRGLAPSAVAEVIANQLLPSDQERDQPLGTSDTLASRLLRLSTTPVAAKVKEGVSDLLYELSGNDPTTFIRNVGYGYAAGYLLTKEIAVPESSVREDVGAKVTTVDGRDVNPITGQRRDMEPPDPGQNMTDEEKEREAERLFVLFERLKATGVMNVTNPVELAARAGKLEEINDDDEDDDESDK